MHIPILLMRLEMVRWVYDQSKNMNKSLFGSEDDASKQILAKDFVKSNAQAEMINQMTN